VNHADLGTRVENRKGQSGQLEEIRNNKVVVFRNAEGRQIGARLQDVRATPATAASRVGTADQRERDWGHLTKSDIGSIVQTKRGEQGVITEVGEVVVKYRLANGKISGAKKSDGRVMTEGRGRRAVTGHAFGSGGAMAGEPGDRMPDVSPGSLGAHEPDPPVPPPPPRRDPISGKVDLRSAPGVHQAAVERVVQLMDLAHDEGGLRPGAIVAQRREVPWSSYNPVRREIRLMPGTDIPHYETAHELAHWIDHGDSGDIHFR
jgi:uncharacterized protein YkvS